MKEPTKPSAWVAMSFTARKAPLAAQSSHWRAALPQLCMRAQSSLPLAHDT